MESYNYNEQSDWEKEQAVINIVETMHHHHHHHHGLASEITNQYLDKRDHTGNKCSYVRVLSLFYDDRSRNKRY